MCSSDLVIGDVAAGTGVLAAENIEEVMPLPSDFTGEGDLFMLRVRGDSMIELGILDGDFVVALKQPTANDGDMVVAGIPNEEATVKTFSQSNDQVILTPANSNMSAMRFSSNDITIYGKVVSVLRKL